jgi:hypothetical protein
MGKTSLESLFTQEVERRAAVERYMCQSWERVCRRFLSQVKSGIQVDNMFLVWLGALPPKYAERGVMTPGQEIKYWQTVRFLESVEGSGDHKYKLLIETMKMRTLVREKRKFLIKEMGKGKQNAQTDQTN